jgi:hypothetical protein
VSEQANTIITQIDNIIRNAQDLKLNMNSMNFIMDNHATQKNSYVLGYLEALAKHNVISHQGNFFL